MDHFYFVFVFVFCEEGEKQFTKVSSFGKFSSEQTANMLNGESLGSIWLMIY